MFQKCEIGTMKYRAALQYCTMHIQYVKGSTYSRYMTIQTVKLKHNVHIIYRMSSKNKTIIVTIIAYKQYKYEVPTDVQWYGTVEYRTYSMYCISCTFQNTKQYKTIYNTYSSAQCTQWNTCTQVLVRYVHIFYCIYMHIRYIYNIYNKIFTKHVKCKSYLRICNRSIKNQSPRGY